jgi:hypothetical protein
LLSSLPDGEIGMRKIGAALMFLWAGIETSGANYCRPEWRESIHYPQIPQTYPPDPWMSIETMFAIVATAIVFFILGGLFNAGSVNKTAVRSEIDKAFNGRQGEAATHGREKKLSRPLEAARKSVISALEKMGLA